MRLNMESDQIRSEHAIQQLLLPGAYAEGFRVGPGNVPKQRDARVGPRFLEHSRQERKVVISRGIGPQLAALPLSNGGATR
jgi:hypothetical protein